MVKFERHKNDSIKEREGKGDNQAILTRSMRNDWKESLIHKTKLCWYGAWGEYQIWNPLLLDKDEGSHILWLHVTIQIST